MARTLKDRLWARGMNPYMVKRSGANMVRAIVNMRGYEDLSEYRKRLKAGDNPDTVVRLARFAMIRQRQNLQLWKDRGGYLP